VHRIGDAVSATLDAAVRQGGPRAMVPELVSLLVHAGANASSKK
jgi:hypothetical protein